MKSFLKFSLTFLSILVVAFLVYQSRNTNLPSTDLVAQVQSAQLQIDDTAITAKDASRFLDRVGSFFQELRKSDGTLFKKKTQDVSFVDSQSVIVEGILSVNHFDDLELQTQEYFYTLRQDNGEYISLTIPEGVHPMLPPDGSRVRIEGDMHSPKVLDLAIEDFIMGTNPEVLSGPPIGSSRQGYVDPLGDLKTAVILFKYQDQTDEPFSVGQAQSDIFTGARSVRAYFDEVSSGRTGVVGALDPNQGDVFGWVTVPRDFVCGPHKNNNVSLNDILNEARDNAIPLGFDQNNGYDLILFVNPQPSDCEAGGGGVQVAEGALIFNSGSSINKGTVIHEIGHNFSLSHARAKACFNSKGVSVSTITSNTPGYSCDITEYGDPYSPMGQGWLEHHFAAGEKSELGYIDSSSIEKTNTSKKTYRLYHAEEALPGVTQFIRVPRGYGEDITLEYRKSSGAFDDFGNNPIATGGVLIREGLALLDMHPGTSTLDDAALEVGETFTYDLASLKITFVSKTADFAILDIQTTEDTFCQRGFPEAFIDISPQHRVLSPGGQASYRVRITQNVSGACGMDEFIFNPRPFSGPVGSNQVGSFPVTVDGESKSFIFFSLVPHEYKDFIIEQVPPVSQNRGTYTSSSFLSIWVDLVGGYHAVDYVRLMYDVDISKNSQQNITQ